MFSQSLRHNKSHIRINISSVMHFCSNRHDIIMKLSFLLSVIYQVLPQQNLLWQVYERCCQTFSLFIMDLKEAKVFYACTFDIIIMYAFRYLFLFRVSYMATQKRSRLEIYSGLSWSVRHEWRMQLTYFLVSHDKGVLM